MKLEALREIAGNRTPGKWDYDWGNWDIENSDRETLCCFNSDCREAGLEKQGHDDGEFIALAANTYDLLLDIAEFVRDGLAPAWLPESVRLKRHTLLTALERSP